MPLADTLQSVEHDIQRGDLGKAISRLHGLMTSYPDNLDLRTRLGELYWQLQNPAMAGRYWYLVEAKDDRMQDACTRFEDEFRRDPHHILSALKFKGNADGLRGTYAGRMLDDLERQARKKYFWYPAYRKNGRKEEENRTQTARGFFFQFGCLLALALVVSLALIGLFTTVSAMVKWLP